MRLVRFGKITTEKPGIIDKTGQLFDVSTLFTDFSPKEISHPNFLNQLLAIKTDDFPQVSESYRLGSCITHPGKIICVGYNSRGHTEQMGGKTLSNHEMLLFMKPSQTICGPNDPIFFTKNSRKLDWEAELAIVIGKQGKYISEENAKDHILGYTCMNDLSDRYWQYETEDKQFTKGKCFDNSAPIGPYLVTKDEITNANELNVNLWVNDILRQTFNTNEYIHNDVQIISYVSQFFTLYPGDIISMGSGPGSASAWGKDMFLKPNDKVTLSIEHLGTQQQTVIKE